MNVLHILPLFTLILFCYFIAAKIRQLKAAGIQTSSFSLSFKTLLGSLFLVAFYFVFLWELWFLVLPNNLPGLPNALRTFTIQSQLLEVLGCILLVLSLFCLQATLNAMKSSLRFGLYPENFGKLVTTGIFSSSRNPFFISIFLMLLGNALIFPTPFFMGVGLLAAPAIHLFILKEERFMHKTYGKEYLDYTRKVRRYF